MRRILSASIPVIALAALGACGDGPGSDRLLAPSPADLAATTAEGSRGAIVEYDQSILFFFHFDARRGLLSAHVPADLCAGAPPNVGDRQIVTTPSAIQQRLVKATDIDSRVAVYRAESADDPFPDLCAFLDGPGKVAEGVVHHTQTFTNASFAAHWGGTVQGVDGSTYHLSESYQLTADAHDPNNPELWSLNASRILLSPRGR